MRYGALGAYRLLVPANLSFAIRPSHGSGTRRGRMRSPLLVCRSKSCYLGCTLGMWSPLPSLSRRRPSCRAWLGFVSGCLVPILFPYLCCSWWSCKGPGSRALPFLLLCRKVCVHRVFAHPLPCETDRRCWYRRAFRRPFRLCALLLGLGADHGRYCPLPAPAVLLHGAQSTPSPSGSTRE